MLIWLYIIAFISSHVLAFKMIRNSWADKSSGCSIGKLNDYRLVSFGVKGSDSGVFIPIDSSGRGDIDENIFRLRSTSIEGYALIHGIPCSIHNNTVLLYAQAYQSSVHLDILLGSSDDGIKAASITVDVDGNLTTDATITKNDLWVNSGWFVTVWSQKASTDDAYTLHAKPIFLDRDVSYTRSFSDNKRMDDNIDRADQRDSKIVKSAISERIFVVWSEYDAIYGKIYSDVIEMFSENDIQKFQIVSVSDSKIASLSATEIQIYQILPLSVGGFIVLFDVMSVKDNEFYFVILSENGVNAFDDILSINSIFALYDPNYIGFAQMIEMPLTLDDRSCTFIGFIYSKYDDNPGNSFIEYTSYYAIWIFFHLDYSNGLFFYTSPYHDRHNVMTKLHDSGSCYVYMGCFHYETSPRKLCFDLNSNGGYLLAGFTQGLKGDILHGYLSSFTDYYNCYSALDLIKYLCINNSDESDEVNDTYVMHGCFNKYPYYIGDNLNQFKRIYFDYELGQYIINNAFVCNISEIDGYTDITECDGNWRTKLNVSIVTNLTIFGEPCDDFEIPATTTATMIDPQDNINALYHTTTTKSADTTLDVNVSAPSLTYEEEGKRSASSGKKEIKGSTIAIIVVVVFVAPVAIGIAVYILIVKKSSFDAKQKQPNKDNAVPEEQINLKETDDTQKVQPIHEGEDTLSLDA